MPVAKYEGTVIKEKEELKEEIEDDDNDNDDDFAAAATQCINDDLSGEVQDEKSKLSTEQTYDNLLADCGVQFAQSTKSVVGSSEEEKKLSDLAMKNVFWEGVDSQLPANEVVSSSDDNDVQDNKIEKEIKLFSRKRS